MDNRGVRCAGHSLDLASEALNTILVRPTQIQDTTQLWVVGQFDGGGHSSSMHGSDEIQSPVPVFSTLQIQATRSFAPKAFSEPGAASVR